MQDVAQLAGVSAQTVSRVLRNHPYVKEPTRAAVMNAVHILGYTMNTSARALSSGRTRTIGVVTVASGSYAAAVTVSELDQAAKNHGYRTVNAHIDQPHGLAIAQALNDLEQQGVEGIVIAAPLPTDAPDFSEIAQRTPMVTIGGSPVTQARSLDVDQSEVARIATKHLLDLGHPTVWHVAGPQNWVDARNRIHGWKQELTAHNKAIPPICNGDWTPESGYQAGLKLGANPQVTAIFVANDEMAFGLIRGLNDRGKRVPEDVSVVSVDNIELAPYASPPLTTVAQPFHALSQAAVERLVSTLESGGNPVEELPEAIQPKLVVRHSATRFVGNEAHPNN